MITEGIHRRRRERVDGVGADQLLDVEDVAVGRVFRPRARPQQTLGLRAGPLREILPASAAKERLIVLVGKLGAGDGDLAAQSFEGGPLLGRRRALQAFGNRLIHHRVDPAEEEAGDAGDSGDIAAFGGARLEALDIGSGDRLIG